MRSLIQMTPLMMSDQKKDDLLSLLSRGSGVFDAVIGRCGFRVALSKEGPYSFIKFHFECDDGLSISDMITEDLVFFCYEAPDSRFVIIRTTLWSSKVFVNMIDGMLAALLLPSRSQAIKGFSNIAKEYLSFYARSRSLILSKEKQRGILGELVFLNKALKSAVDSIEVLEFWQGPSGHPQDFIFPSSTGFEIKTRMSLEHSVKISNEKQLDWASLDDLFLVVFPVSEHPDGISIFDMAVSILAGRDKQFQDLFYDKLKEIGLEAWLVEYHNTHKVKLSEASIYPITSDSAVITSTSLPTAVSNVAYKLNLSGFPETQVSLDQLIKQALDHE